MIEFNLSKCEITDWDSLEGDKTLNDNWIRIKDVKEFIKRVKEEILPDDTQNPYLLYSDVCRKIEKLAGEKLT